MKNIVFLLSLALLFSCNSDDSIETPDDIPVTDEQFNTHREEVAQDLNYLFQNLGSTVIDTTKLKKLYLYNSLAGATRVAQYVYVGGEERNKNPEALIDGCENVFFHQSGKREHAITGYKPAWTGAIDKEIWVKNQLVEKNGETYNVDLFIKEADQYVANIYNEDRNVYNRNYLHFFGRLVNSFPIDYTFYIDHNEKLRFEVLETSTTENICPNESNYGIPFYQASHSKIYIEEELYEDAKFFMDGYLLDATYYHDNVETLNIKIPSGNLDLDAMRLKGDILIMLNNIAGYVMALEPAAQNILGDQLNGIEITVGSDTLILDLDFTLLPEIDNDLTGIENVKITDAITGGSLLQNGEKVFDLVLDNGVLYTDYVYGNRRVDASEYLIPNFSTLEDKVEEAFWVVMRSILT